MVKVPRQSKVTLYSHVYIVSRQISSMLDKPKALLVVDIRELALIYEMSQAAAKNETLDSSDRQTARKLHGDCAKLLGRKK